LNVSLKNGDVSYEFIQLMYNIRENAIIKHYRKIVTSLQKTIEVQKAIDDIYPEVEKETVEIENR
jgi:hypothetical protein